MNKKFVYTITAAIAVSTASVFAADEAAVKTLEERIAALEGATKASSWAENLKIKGDVRYRYEYKAKDDDTDKDRHRIRARIGAYGNVTDEVKVGVRLATGSTKIDTSTGLEEPLESGPTSSNQTIEGGFSQKPIWLDLAYITYSPAAIDGLSVTMGKMKQPWVSVSDLIFDGDVNPEGISSSYNFGSDALSLTATVAYHMLDDKGTGEDDNLTSGQIAAEAKVAEDIKLTLGTSAFYYSELDFEIVNGFAKADVKKGPLPIKVYGEYLNNIASAVEEDTAWLAGIGTKYKKVSLDYNYRDLEANSVNDDLDDGDFGGPDGKGHKIKAKYSIAKNVSTGATYFRVDDGGVDVDLLQVDFAVKF